ncbi:MAG: PrsW family glutamic-type intramembrane protease [Planctomycetaceae bacterium]
MGETPSHDPSVSNEPHLGSFGPPPTSSSDLDADQIEQTVWDEPALSGAPISLPEDAATYAKWLRVQIAGTSYVFSWGMCLLVALAAGPFSVLTSILYEMTAGVPGFILATTIVAPITEELMKVAIALWVVEKRPYWFVSGWQVMFCAAAGGLVFGALENVLYLDVRIENPPPALVYWRWTVCTALHVGCASISGIGLLRIWRNSIGELSRPRLQDGAVYAVLAIAIHSIYNAFAIAYEVVGGGF